MRILEATAEAQMMFVADLFAPPVVRDLPSELRAFNAFGMPTRIVEDGGLIYFVNEFWTARQRQADRVHEISYRACSSSRSFQRSLPSV